MGFVVTFAMGCGSATTAANNTNTGNTGNTGGNNNTNVPASVEVTPAGPLTFDVLKATQALSATVKNSSGTAITATVTWTSDAPSVASIPAAGGVVSANANGTAHITAKTDNGVTSAPLTVVVQVKATTIAPLVRIAGDSQQAVVNTSLVAPLTVQANDANGNPQPGVSVSFKTTFGTMSATTVLTGANGQATSVWNMPTVSGPGTATATLVNNSAASVTFSAVALTGPPQQMVKVGGDAQRGSVSAVLPNPLIVGVTDQFNNGIPGIPVSFAVTTGGGALSAANAVTGADGRVSVTWILGNNEGQAQSVAVTSPGLNGSPGLFSATAIRATVGTLAPTPFRAGCHVSTTVTGISIGDTPSVTATFDGVPAAVTLTNPTLNGLTLTAVAPTLTRASGTAATIVIKIFSQTFTQNLIYDPVASCS
jgi:hypothetical protein